MATIFTKIIRGDIPCYKVAENDRFFAFLDINPSSEGHTLVVPKQETDYLFDLDDDMLSEMVLYARDIAGAIDRALGCIRTGLIVQGLEVPHAHIHLIPIYKTSQPFSLGKKVDLSKEQMEQVAAKIRSEMKS
ncbi:MAG: HIT family protein [Balneolaceae bacterium]|nr:MAG: HIT family protein [Balneolaceae bacterium]